MKIIEDLIAFFFSESKISFPGFGTLTLERKEAKRNPVKNKIFGPKHSGIFHYNEYDENSTKKFLEFYCKKNNKDLIDADNELKKLSLNLLNKFATSNSADLEGFGTFIKKNDDIFFEFSAVLSEILEKSYPDYPLLVMNREETTRQTLDILEKQESSENPDEIVEMPVMKKQRSIVGPILISLVALSFLCLLICVLDVLNTKKPGITSIEDQGQSAQPVEIQKQDPEDPKSDDMSVFDETNTSDIVENDIPEQNDILPVPVDQKTEAEKINKGIITLDALIIKSSENKNLYNNTCIVITGSFRSKSNAKRILEKIINAGFVPYAERYGRNYRIGTISDISIISPESQLSIVTDKIEKQSWILQPKQD